MFELREGTCVNFFDVAALIQRCQTTTTDARFQLRDLLALPMQRVLKYHLFLKVCLLRSIHTCTLHRYVMSGATGFCNPNCHVTEKGFLFFD